MWRIRIKPTFGLVPENDVAAAADSPVGDAAFSAPTDRGTGFSGFDLRRVDFQAASTF
ncbi:MAG: hypothetical protein NTV93_00900 [Verrucomicrobia bacterium]|nr:hypothetical protein [Verrucomicrobiota bacterium]